MAETSGEAGGGAGGSRDDFVHLHVHTDYSMLDGAGKVKDYVAEAKRLGQPALAITDHGYMFGAYEFYAAAKAGLLGMIKSIALEHGRDPARMRAELGLALGQAWDDELEPFRFAGAGAPVRWLHRVG